MKIGFLEDDDAQAALVCAWLAEEGHEVLRAATGKAFLALFNEQTLDIAIFDWELPDMSGVDVLTSLRQQFNSRIPVLFTTQRDSENDIVTALKAGADDYLCKPVRQAELVARLEALARRTGVALPSDQIQLGPISLDARAEEVRVEGELIKLTRKDYLVALQLISNFGKILSREYLLKQVWGIDAGLDTRTVDVHISRVRRSLNIGPHMGYTIKTIYQHGYRLEKVL